MIDIILKTRNSKVYGTLVGETQHSYKLVDFFTGKETEIYNGDIQIKTTISHPDKNLETSLKLIKQSNLMDDTKVKILNSDDVSTVFKIASFLKYLNVDTLSYDSEDIIHKIVDIINTAYYRSQNMIKSDDELTIDEQNFMLGCLKKEYDKFITIIENNDLGIILDSWPIMICSKHVNHDIFRYYLDNKQLYENMCGDLR